MEQDGTQSISSLFLGPDLDTLDDQASLPLPTSILEHGEFHFSWAPGHGRPNLPCRDLYPSPSGLLHEVLSTFLFGSVRKSKPEIYWDPPPVSRIPQHDHEQNLIGCAWRQSRDLVPAMDFKPADIQ